MPTQGNRRRSTGTHGYQGQGYDGVFPFTPRRRMGIVYYTRRRNVSRGRVLNRRTGVSNCASRGVFKREQPTGELYRRRHGRSHRRNRRRVRTRRHRVQSRFAIRHVRYASRRYFFPIYGRLRTRHVRHYRHTTRRRGVRPRAHPFYGTTQGW